jgi:hypothetical protein
MATSPLRTSIRTLKAPTAAPTHTRRRSLSISLHQHSPPLSPTASSHPPPQVPSSSSSTLSTSALSPSSRNPPPPSSPTSYTFAIYDGPSWAAPKRQSINLHSHSTSTASSGSSTFNGPSRALPFNAARPTPSYVASRARLLNLKLIPVQEPIVDTNLQDKTYRIKGMTSGLPLRVVILGYLLSSSRPAKAHLYIYLITSNASHPPCASTRLPLSNPTHPNHITHTIVFALHPKLPRPLRCAIHKCM